MHLDPRPANERPWREVEEYKVLTNLTVQWEASERERLRRKALMGAGRR